MSFLPVIICGGSASRRQSNTCLGLLYLVPIMLAICNGCSGYQTYFSLSDVRVTLPRSADFVSRLPNMRPLLQFTAKSLHPLSFHRMVEDSSTDESSETESHSPAQFTYDIYNTYGLMSIDQRTGAISMSGQQFRQLGANVTVIVEAAASPANDSTRENLSDSAGNVDRPAEDVAKMSLTIATGALTSVPEYCSDLAAVCFWDSVVYKIVESSIVWNRTVGALGPRLYRQLCPGLIVEYRLLNATEFFTIRDDTIYTSAHIDHDSLSPGPHMAATVQCRVTRAGNAVQRTANRLLDFVILDRNDNAPVLHATETNISVQLKSPYYHEGAEVGKGIMFSDSDSLSQNTRILYEILHDTRQLLHPKCQSFEVNQMGLHTSVFNCKLYFTRTGYLNQSPYCVIIRATDPTVDLPHGTVGKSAEATVCLLADTTKIHSSDRVIVPQALKSSIGLESAQANRKKNRKNRKLVSGSDETSSSMGSNESTDSPKKMQPIFYPHEVIVSRKSTNRFRVVEPINMRELVRNGGPVFKLTEDPTGALGITSSAGIVYVRNVTALRKAAGNVYNVTIVFFDKKAQIHLRLVDSLPFTLLNTSTVATCSTKDNRADCLQTLGHGTDGTGCAWRSSNSSVFTPNYATCSPSLLTCPDNVCDSLEALAQQSGEFICPQDCTPSENIFGPHRSDVDVKMGIRSAVGTCMCDEYGHCHCGNLYVEPTGSAKSKKNKSLLGDVTAQPSAEFVGNVSFVRKGMMSALTVEDCGVTCILLVALCPVILLVIALSVFVSRRRMQTRKARKQDQKPELSDADVVLDTTETIALADFPSNRITILSTIPTEFSFTSDPDSKWEFPRNQLVLDTTLGEGEFGRVVKAYATDISGKSGVTTVAVKMLKTGANSVELLALLSEFQLLQEVTHPNVIQLLGACTQESPLVIIEYAKHGSLRSYLRISRKLECSGIEFSDGVEPMTVRDILSFALQICKGMAYLTEIKLVHRDLAARNVLLTEGKICKISDFGLTRDVYEDDAYLKRSKDRVPVKWMAPESLADHVYTTRSDVWAFGVLAWELITLGASPYPGIPPQNLYHLLKTGYRMERPDNCSEEVYSIIRSCWTDDPHIRPPFKWLASQWEALLGNNAKYIEMELNSVSNPLYCAEQMDAISTADTTDASDTTLEVGAASAGDEDAAAIQLENIVAQLGEPDKIDHLWHPPRTPTQSVSTPDRTVPLPMGYDIPRPLIEARTDEQALRYQNELRTSPLRTIAKATTDRNSGSGSLAANLSHYDRPAVQRRKSYMDMLAIDRTSSVGYNLDRENVEKKRLTKDISFRFSSLLNLSEHFTSPPM